MPFVKEEEEEVGQIAILVYSVYAAILSTLTVRVVGLEYS